MLKSNIHGERKIGNFFRLWLNSDLLKKYLENAGLMIICIYSVLNLLNPGSPKPSSVSSSLTSVFNLGTTKHINMEIYKFIIWMGDPLPLKCTCVPCPMKESLIKLTQVKLNLPE